MIIFIENDLKEKELIQQIRSVDTLGKIVVLRKNSFDIKAFYQSKDHHEVFVVRPNVTPYTTNFGLLENCLFCDSGNSQVRVINTWKPDVGFMREPMLPNSLKNSFFGSVLDVLTYFDSQGRKAFKLDLMLSTLAGMINANFHYHPINYKYVLREDPSNYNTRVKWQLSGYPTIIGTSSYFTKYDFTTPFHVDRRVIISYIPPEGLVLYRLFSPFAGPVGICIIITFILASYTLYISEGTRLHYLDCLWQIAQILCWDSLTFHPRRISTYLLLAIFMIMTFIVVSEVLGTMVGLMAKTEYSYSPINSLEQLWQTDRKVIIQDNSKDFWTHSFKHIPNITDRLHLIKYSHNYDFVAIGLIETNPESFVYITNKVSADWVISYKYTDRFGQHNYFTSQEEFIPQYAAYVMPKNFRYQQTVNLGLMRMIDYGIVQHIDDLLQLRFAYIINKNRMKNSIIPQPTSTLKLTHLFGGILVMGTCLVVSFLALLGEIVFNKLKSGPKL